MAIVPGVDPDTYRLPEAVEAALALAAPVAGKVDKGTIRINAGDYPTLAAALAVATEGAYVHVPARTGGWLNAAGLGNGATVLADDVTIELAAGAVILVQTWGQPGIDCVGRSGVKVLGGVVRYIGTRGDHLGNSGRSSALYNTGCGVFINGDRCTVQGLRTIDMAVGVFLSSWATSTAYDHRGVGNRIKDIEVEGANWGVLWLGQEALVIDGLYFHDDRDDSSGSNPTHAIYCSSTDTYRSYDVTISNLITKNCLYGQPYQLKYCDNLTMTNLVARNSRGLLNVIGCVDLALTNANGTGCLASLSAPFGAITVQGAGAKRHRYQNIAIEVDQVGGVDQRTILIESEDSSIDGLTVVSKRTSSGSAANAVVQIRGLNNTARNLNISDTSGFNPVAITLGGSSVATTGTIVDGVRIAGCIRGFDLYAPASGVVHYSRAMVALTSSAFTSVQSGTPDFSIFEDGVLTVTGSPEGAVTATPGKLAARRDATTGDGVYVKASGTGNTGWQAVTRAPDIQDFTASGTWTKPAGAKIVHVLCIGPGNGGGSGRRGASGTVCGGGGGGAAGIVVRAVFAASDLGASESVTIPTPGAGGAAVTADNTDGNPGGLPSGSTIFGSANPKRVQAVVGASTSSGRGGTTSGGAGGISPFTLGTNSQMSGGGAGGTGAAGTAVNPALLGPAGGPGGGGISGTPAAFAGGGGSYSVMATTSGGTGGVVDTTSPTAGTVPTQKGAPGQSPGGGAASITTAAQAGADATGYGAGGAGGGASLNGNNSGAGGAGGPGYVLVVTYF